MGKIIAIFLIAISLWGDDFKEALEHYEQGDYKKAYELFYLLAKHGDVKSQYNVALMTQKGQGVAADIKEALEWYIKAAKQGYGPAEFNIARYYHSLAVDDSKMLIRAKEWYEKASKNGVIEAFTNLGLLYFEGSEEIPQDIKRGIDYLTMAADANDTKGQLNLGVIYGWKEGVVNDKYKAHTYLQQALKNGEGEASGYLDRLCKESSWVCK